MELPFFSADDLMKERIATPTMIIDDLLPTGLTIFAGKPKLGKSWWALNAAIAVSTGRKFLSRRVDGGDVLYLALEDSKRRLQDRLKKILRGPIPQLTLSLTLPALDKGGDKMIAGWVKRAAAPKLVIVDVLQKVRPEAKGRTLYDDDYNAVAPLKKIADEYGIAVIVITHTRKADFGFDPLDAISATTGLAGAADHNIILDRGEGGLVLYGRGRDTEEIEMGLSFDGETGSFEELGDSKSIHQTKTRTGIIAVLGEAPDGLGPRDIAKRGNLDEDNTKKTLKRMMTDGHVIKVSYGVYRLPLPPVPCAPFADTS